jgi:hypothetical protein
MDELHMQYEEAGLDATASTDDRLEAIDLALSGKSDHIVPGDRGWSTQLEKARAFFGDYCQQMKVPMQSRWIALRHGKPPLMPVGDPVCWQSEQLLGLYPGSVMRVVHVSGEGDGSTAWFDSDGASVQPPEWWSKPLVPPLMAAVEVNTCNSQQSVSISAGGGRTIFLEPDSLTTQEGIRSMLCMLCDVCGDRCGNFRSSFLRFELHSMRDLASRQIHANGFNNDAEQQSVMSILAGVEMLQRHLPADGRWFVAPK